MDEEWFKNQSFWEDFRSILFHGERVERTYSQVQKIVEILDLRRRDRVLDLCCGIGRHSLELARRGYHVTGVDLTKTYIEEARSKAKEERLDIEFIREDMMDFKREETYHAALSIFSSFGYFKKEEDNLKVIDNVYSSLEPGGKFLVDVIGKEVLARIYTKKNWEKMDEGYFLEERIIKNDWGLLENRWILIKDDGVKKGSFYTQLYSARELQNILEKAGFVDIEVYGDLDRSRYDENASRLIVVGRK